MKKSLAIFLVLSAGFALGVSWRELTAHAAGGGGTPKGNGDVNGDGTIDISDAVYTLSWLFTGGKAPVAIVCPPAEGCSLPATGQTKCYNLSGAEIVCSSPDLPGQDGFYRAGCPSAGRFLDHRNGTVTDTCTGLMWEKVSSYQNSWKDALIYCMNLNLAGHSDWRLPNVRELQSIVDYGLKDPAMDPVFEVKLDSYLTSSTVASDPRAIWGINCADGRVIPKLKSSEFPCVRAVRNAP